MQRTNRLDRSAAKLRNNDDRRTTPLKEILQLLKQKKYKIPASIEYEYDTPQGSDELTEIKKCVDFCRKALA